MKRILLATAGVAVVAVVAAAIGFAQPSATTGVVRAEAAAPAAAAAGEHQVAAAVHRRRQVRRAAVRLHQRPGQERRLRRRDRQVVRPLRVRPREPRLVRLRADPGPRAAAHDRPRRPRHLDVHLHRRPRHADRLLARLLQGHGPAAREERRAGAVACRHRRNRKVATTSGSIYDRWLRRCFPSTQVIVTDSFTNALLAFNQGRADALMWDDTVLVGVAAADRTSKLTNDTFLDAAVRHRHQAGQRRAEAVGRLAARADAQEGHVPAHPPEQRPGALRRRLLEEHPPAEQHLRVRAGRRAERGHGVPVAVDRTITTTGSGRQRAAASSSSR